jgi:hypothetical protein
MSWQETIGKNLIKNHKNQPVIMLIIESTCLIPIGSLNNIEPTIIVTTNFILLDML